MLARWERKINSDETWTRERSRVKTNWRREEVLKKNIKKIRSPASPADDRHPHALYIRTPGCEGGQKNINNRSPGDFRWLKYSKSPVQQAVCTLSKRDDVLVRGLDPAVARSAPNTARHTATTAVWLVTKILPWKTHHTVSHTSNTSLTTSPFSSSIVCSPAVGSIRYTLFYLASHIGIAGKPNTPRCHVKGRQITQNNIAGIRFDYDNLGSKNIG